MVIPPQEIIPPEAYVYTDIDKIIEETKNVSNKILDNTANILKKNDINCERKISLTGTPVTVILDYAEKNSIDIIALGSHGKKDVSLLLMGSTSTKIAEKSEIPLIIIKRK